MDYYFPFGEKLKPLVQEEQTSKKVFVLGVYASAVHAKWIRDGRVICQALAVASEPRIFWDGNSKEAEEIIGKIKMPRDLGHLEAAPSYLNGPSATVLDNNILKPLGFTRSEAWLCDLLPEARINKSQERAIREKYEPLMEEYSLNPVTVPKRPSVFCDDERAAQITKELIKSDSGLLVLLGDIPIAQYLCRVSNADFSTLGEYTDKYGYGNTVEVEIGGKTIKVLPLAHPRQVGGLGTHSEKWRDIHKNWEISKLEIKNGKNSR